MPRTSRNVRGMGPGAGRPSVGFALKEVVYNIRLMSDWTRTSFDVRSLASDKTREAARLHGRELPHEFLTRFGTAFLDRYYRAFVESPHAAALVVVEPRSGRVDGVLTATFDTRAHYACLVRRHGAALAWHAILQALRHPSLARDLLRTRLWRYGRGILRSLGRPSEKPSVEPPAERVGFLTCVAVAAKRRGRGIGGALLVTYEELARKAGLDRLELVTVLDERGAGPFYTRKGWKFSGERVSRSGERYALYIRYLKG